MDPVLTSLMEGAAHAWSEPLIGCLVRVALSQRARYTMSGPDITVVLPAAHANGIGQAGMTQSLPARAVCDARY